MTHTYMFTHIYVYIFDAGHSTMVKYFDLQYTLLWMKFQVNISEIFEEMFTIHAYYTSSNDQKF